MNEVLETLVTGKDLEEAVARSVLESLTEPATDPALAGAILSALRAKGESAAEVRGFAMGLRERAIRPSIDEVNDAVDIVGTGGDGSGSFNISTGSAVLTAACGVPVIKHGNRSVSSISGSADVLSALGLDIPLDEVESAACLEKTGFTFLFAPHFHPAMKAVVPVRQALGIRTIFNMVGPLANPATPPFHVIGAYSVEAARLLAHAASGMPMERTFVVHGAPGWDEPTPVGSYHLLEVGNGEVTETVEDPLDFGIPRCEPEDLAGWDAEYNAERLRGVFEGEPGPHRHALLLGASLALRVTGRIEDAVEGIETAEKAIDDGRALALLESLANFSKESDARVG